MIYMICGLYWIIHKDVSYHHSDSIGRLRNSVCRLNSHNKMFILSKTGTFSETWSKCSYSCENNYVRKSYWIQSFTRSVNHWTPQLIRVKGVGVAPQRVATGVQTTKLLEISTGAPLNNLEAAKDNDALLYLSFIHRIASTTNFISWLFIHWSIHNKRWIDATKCGGQT
jgi:hypothetical protein